MSYTDRDFLSTDWGCLPAAFFGFVFGVPMGFASIMGECVDENGVGPCPNGGLIVLGVILVTLGMTILTAWATNRMVAAAAGRGRGTAWGVLGGFLLALALLPVGYAVIAVINLVLA